MPQMSQVLKERTIGMLTAGMSISAAARELNVNFSTTSHLQSHFRELGNWPPNRRPCVTTPAQAHHIQLLPVLARLRPATQTADETWGIFVCNKALFVRKTHSDWLCLALQLSTHGCATAKSCEIHRLGSNKCKLTDFLLLYELTFLHVTFIFVQYKTIN